MAANITPHNPLEGPAPELKLNLQDGSDELVTIIIVHKDRPEYLNILLQSIAVTSYNSNYEIVVVDNGSGGESKEFLKDIEKDGIKVVYNDKNLFWSEGCNRGVAAANKKSNRFVFMHCDVVIENPGWLDILLNILESQKCGLVGVEVGNYEINGHKVGFVQEWMMMMTRECYEAIGGWPENLPVLGHAFVVTVAAKQLGFKPQAVSTRLAHHYTIFSLDLNDYERLKESAMVVLPQLLSKAQSRSVDPNFKW